MGAGTDSPSPEARSANPRAFFSREEMARVEAAIRAAEERTSGEIRLHLEKHCHGEPMARAAHLFEKLGMTKTAERNGVLIYLATADHRFAIAGDAGIHAAVGPEFWNSVAAALSGHFSRQDFAGGIEAACAEIGERLRQHFPHGGASDRNELSDEISFDHG